MIHASHRRALLAIFPAGTALSIVAPPGAFDALVAERNDPAVALGTLERTPPPAPNLIVEGLDAVADPVPVLARLRDAAPHARLFALVANACFLANAAAFFDGAAIAAGRPLVRADIEPLLTAAGWQTLAVEPLASPTPIPQPPLPNQITVRNLTFDVADEATFARLSTAAYLAIAQAT